MTSDALWHFCMICAVWHKRLRVMLGWTASRSFSANNFHPEKWVFVLVPKWAQSRSKQGGWADAFSPTFAPQTPLFTQFWTHFRVLAKAILPTWGGKIKCSPRKGLEAALTQHKRRFSQLTSVGRGWTDPQIIWGSLKPQTCENSLCNPISRCPLEAVPLEAVPL